MDGKINGDNLDLYVKTNDIRMNNKNRDLHYFASDLTFDRVRLDHLEDAAPLGDPNNVNVQVFIPSADEMTMYRKSLKYLIGRELAQSIKGLEWMNAIIPTHIPHDMEKVMCERSKIFWLPLQLKNEMYHDQCIQIMNELEKHVNTIYTKAGRGGDLEKLKIVVGGDQMTRCNLQSAKNLRRGCYNQTERLEHLHPIIMEMFHTLMDFLEKLFKRFYSKDGGRDAATLANMKMLIQRTNVNGQVKSRFEAHEEFVLLIGKAYLLVLAMKIFKMENIEDSPKHPLLKNNMKYLQNKPKEEVFDALMEEILDCSLVPFQLDEGTVNVKTVELEVSFPATGQKVNVTGKIEGNTITFPLCVNNRSYVFSAPKENICTKSGWRLCLPTEFGVINMTVMQTRAPLDDLKNYVHNFIQWYYVVLNFKDTMKEGDIYRTNMLLKMMIPFFYSHSALSKYFVECIDYILKTEVMLSPRLSMRIRLSSYVNPKGGKGKNKAADMQKENEVRILKDLIRGLGANKTEHAIVTISKAAPVISDISTNFDRALKIKEGGTTHKKRDDRTDLITLVNALKKMNIWSYVPGRVLSKSNKVSETPFKFDKNMFKLSILTTVDRLKLGIPISDLEEEELEGDNEDDGQ
ncbi:uncharacterized protein LOC134250228 [Saccostrea cucullata]|uniref:uncharacterized protein LOC134250228 n=1 Tax=Saccostrea cuccullata TaxID=36930 RepID=UPI002ED2F5BD